MFFILVLKCSNELYTNYNDKLVVSLDLKYINKIYDAAENYSIVYKILTYAKKTNSFTYFFEENIIKI